MFEIKIILKKFDEMKLKQQQKKNKNKKYVLLSDLFKLVSYLKESHRDEDKNRIIPIQMNKNELKERGSVFRQVFEKDKELFNHSYLKKRRNPVS